MKRKLSTYESAAAQNRRQREAAKRNARKGLGFHEGARGPNASAESRRR